jgi:hypothetical protein
LVFEQTIAKGQKSVQINLDVADGEYIAYLSAFNGQNSKEKLIVKH